jgi:GntR family transcriptional regulator, carbon starvation induced regulator
MPVQNLELSAPPEEDAGQSLTIRAYSKLRAQIISGRLAPGQRLKVETLRDLIEVGATPIREALSLLTSDGLVERLDKRGFRVSEVSLAEYDDLHRTRCWFEERALRESVGQGDQAWEDRLVLVHHRLRRLPRTLEEETGPHSNPEWERMHKLFHMSLLSASPSKTLLQFCDQLHDRLNRYRSVAAVGAHAPRDWKTEHDLIAEAVLDRNADLAVTRLMQHYSRTTDILLETLTNLTAEP